MDFEEYWAETDLEEFEDDYRELMNTFEEHPNWDRMLPPKGFPHYSGDLLDPNIENWVEHCNDVMENTDLKPTAGNIKYYADEDVYCRINIPRCMHDVEELMLHGQVGLEGSISDGYEEERDKIESLMKDVESEYFDSDSWEIRVPIEYDIEKLSETVDELAEVSKRIS